MLGIIEDSRTEFKVKLVNDLGTGIRRILKRYDKSGSSGSFCMSY